MDDVALTVSVTVSQYRQLVLLQDRSSLARFVEERFFERYISPIRPLQGAKHGFCTMAISCLMIEALESFHQAWPDTHGKSKCAFRSFFRRCEESGHSLRVFHPLADDFYRNVRCGLLHQAETTGGWRIRRKGSLLNSKTINATRFHNALSAYLLDYRRRIEQASWDDATWLNFRIKMDAVIANCQPTAQQEAPAIQ